MDLFCLRATGATALFWLLSLFMPKEKVPLKDLPKIFVASMLGLFLTQISFLKAVTMTTSIDLSIANTCTPILTMVVAAIVLKEPITGKKIGGVLLSLTGVLLLIFNSVGLGGGASETKPLGIVLTIVNAFTFALYLGIFRPLISKYNVVTFMKWMFLFSNGEQGVMAGGFCGGFCHVCRLFPNPCGAKTASSDPCQHVQLHPTHHCHPYQHLHRPGPHELAKMCGYGAGFHGCLDCQPKPCGDVI